MNDDQFVVLNQKENYNLTSTNIEHEINGQTYCLQYMDLLLNNCQNIKRETDENNFESTINSIILCLMDNDIFPNTQIINDAIDSSQVDVFISFLHSIMIMKRFSSLCDKSYYKIFKGDITNFDSPAHQYGLRLTTVSRKRDTLLPICKLHPDLFTDRFVLHVLKAIEKTWSDLFSSAQIQVINLDPSHIFFHPKTFKIHILPPLTSLRISDGSLDSGSKEIGHCALKLIFKLIHPQHNSFVSPSCIKLLKKLIDGEPIRNIFLQPPFSLINAHIHPPSKAETTTEYLKSIHEMVIQKGRQFTFDQRSELASACLSCLLAIRSGKLIEFNMEGTWSYLRNRIGWVGIWKSFQQLLDIVEKANDMERWLEAITLGICFLLELLSEAELFSNNAFSKDKHSLVSPTPCSLPKDRQIMLSLLGWTLRFCIAQASKDLLHIMNTADNVRFANSADLFIVKLKSLMRSADSDIEIESHALLAHPLTHAMCKAFPIFAAPTPSRLQLHASSISLFDIILPSACKTAWSLVPLILLPNSSLDLSTCPSFIHPSQDVELLMKSIAVSHTDLLQKASQYGLHGYQALMYLFGLADDQLIHQIAKAEKVRLLEEDSTFSFQQVSDSAISDCIGCQSDKLPLSSNEENLNDSGCRLRRAFPTEKFSMESNTKTGNDTPSVLSSNIISTVNNSEQLKQTEAANDSILNCDETSLANIDILNTLPNECILANKSACATIKKEIIAFPLIEQNRNSSSLKRTSTNKMISDFDEEILLISTRDFNSNAISPEIAVKGQQIISSGGDESRIKTTETPYTTKFNLSPTTHSIPKPSWLTTEEIQSAITNPCASFSPLPIQMNVHTLYPKIPISEIKQLIPLSEGGSGRIFIATWRFTLIAVKFFKSNTSNSFSAQSAGETSLIIQEASILSSLRHPNILLFMGITTSSTPLNNPGIVTEYCSGGSLYHALHTVRRPDLFGYNSNAKPTETPPLKVRLNLAIQAARAVAFLHSCTPPIAHRDIKSLNVLLSSAWDPKWPDVVPTVKLADFGYSHYVNRVDRRGSTRFMGTCHWAAPEMLISGGDDSVDALAADVYSFGCVLYELIANRVPFVEEFDITDRFSINNEEITKKLEGQIISGRRPTSKFLPQCEIGKNVKDILRSCWDHCSQRPTMEHVLSLLEKIQANIQWK